MRWRLPKAQLTGLVVKNTERLSEAPLRGASDAIFLFAYRYDPTELDQLAEQGPTQPIFESERPIPPYDTNSRVSVAWVLRHVTSPAASDVRVGRVDGRGMAHPRQECLLPNGTGKAGSFPKRPGHIPGVP